MKWNFVPSKSGHYDANVSENGEFKAGADFQVENLNEKLNLLFPLKQLKSGIAAQDVQCNKGFSLVIKAEDGSPSCVKPDTSNILIERGWAKVLQ